MTRLESGRLGAARLAELRLVRQRRAWARLGGETAALRRVVRAIAMDRRPLWLRALEARRCS